MAAGTEVGKYRLTAFFFPLYTRLKKEEMLDNTTRGMIRGCIYTDPGIHYNEILRRLKMRNGTAAHHLIALEREGFIRSKSDGRMKRFYPSEMKPADVSPGLNKTQKMILETVQENEGISQGKIADYLEIPYPTINRHVSKLVETGDLRLERHGMTIKCFTNFAGASKAEAPGGNEAKFGTTPPDSVGGAVTANGNPPEDSAGGQGQ